VNVIETERLQLRKLTADDAAFMLELLNEPSFLRFIGDRGVRNLDDARRYILQGPVASYEQHGYGLWLVELQATQAPIGLCGLVKREALPDADIGYAFLPRYWSQGYAYEAAAAVLSYAGNVLGLKRLLAITDQENAASIKVLTKIGLKFDRLIRLAEEAPEIMLFASDA
jgi:RimJ/RimL family protein N-acetyltransferase